MVEGEIPESMHQVCSDGGIIVMMTDVQLAAWIAAGMPPNAAAWLLSESSDGGADRAELN